MHRTRFYARLRARFAAGVGQFRDTILPRYTVPSTRKPGSSRKRKRRAAAPH
jgi:hypothetical protein